MSCHTELCSSHQRRLDYGGDIFCGDCQASALAGRASEIAESLRAAGVRTPEECALRIILESDRGLYKDLSAGVSPIVILESFSGRTPGWASEGEWLEDLVAVLRPDPAELDEVVWEKYERKVTGGFFKPKTRDYVKDSGTVKAWVVRSTNHNQGRDWPYSILVTEGGQIIPAGLVPDSAARLRYGDWGSFGAFSGYEITAPAQWQVADHIRDRVNLRACLSSWDRSYHGIFRSAVAGWMIENLL